MNQFDDELRHAERGLPALQLGYYDETTRTGYLIEEGCNCVLLGTRVVGADGAISYYGSCGSIDQSGMYSSLVLDKKLTDLRSFLPYRSKMPFREWMRRCHLAKDAFLNPPPPGAEA